MSKLSSDDSISKPSPRFDYKTQLQQNNSDQVGIVEKNLYHKEVQAKNEAKFDQKLPTTKFSTTTITTTTTTTKTTTAPDSLPGLEKLYLIVPHRDREEHKRVFLDEITTFLSKKASTYN